MKLCPICRRCYEDTDTACSKDHTALVTARAGTRLIADKYRLERLLSRSSKSSVYTGTDIELNRPVVIELLLTNVLADPDGIERFRREIRASTGLNQQNAAEIHDYGPLPDGGAYIIMKRVEAQTGRGQINGGPSLADSSATQQPARPAAERGLSSGGAAAVKPARMVTEATQEVPRQVLSLSPTASSHPAPVNNQAALDPDEITQQFPRPVLPPPAASSRQDTVHLSEPRPPILVDIPSGARARANRRPLVYAGLAAALALGVALVWLAFRPAPVSPSGSPAASPVQPPVKSAPAANTTAAGQVSPAATVADNSPVMRRGRSVASAAYRAGQSTDPHVTSRGALNEWVDAITSRDIDKQMAFYAPTVDTFYLQRHVAQADVRAEKDRLFGQAKAIDVRLMDEPQITFSNAGRIATMRVRLSYVIEGAEQTRRGEVIRELRWMNTDEGWKIVGERDVRVIR